MSEEEFNPVIGVVGLDEFDRRVLFLWGIKVVSGVRMS